MASTLSPTYSQDELFLPWVESANDRRFKRILVIFVTVFTVVGAVVPFVPVPEIVKKELSTVSPRISKLIMEQKKQPPPPPPPEVKKKIEKKKPVKKKPREDRQSDTYKKAASSGLVALSSELEDLRSEFDFADIESKPLKQSKGVEKQDFRKDLISAKATSASAGIDTAKLSRSTSGQQLSGRATTKVSSDIGVAPVPARGAAAGGGRKATRDEREIERVFQKNKGAIYSIYNRALRKDPTLEGKVVVELTIGPDGRVSMAKIVSSELNAPSLERKIIARVKLFKFKPGNVETTTVQYPIDFLPS